jgi:hypothetical protein
MVYMTLSHVEVKLCPTVHHRILVRAAPPAEEASFFAFEYHDQQEPGPSSAHSHDTFVLYRTFPSLDLQSCQPCSALFDRSKIMANKVERIVARLQEKIKDGDYYEAQQQTRTAATRYTKTKNWPAAVDILSSVAQSLLKAGQGGSGGDLCTMLVDVYKQAEMKPDAANKGRLLTCLRLFDGEEPTRKKFITEMMG